MNFNRGLDEIYGFGRHEESISNLADAPLPKVAQPNTPSEHVLTYALKAATKQGGDGDDEDKNPNSAKNIKEPIATADMYDDSIPDFLGAEFAGQQTNLRL